MKYLPLHFQTLHGWLFPWDFWQNGDVPLEVLKHPVGQSKFLPLSWRQISPWVGLLGWVSSVEYPALGQSESNLSTRNITKYKVSIQRDYNQFPLNFHCMCVIKYIQILLHLPSCWQYKLLGHVPIFVPSPGLPSKIKIKWNGMKLLPRRVFILFTIT